MSIYSSRRRNISRSNKQSGIDKLQGGQEVRETYP